MVQLSPQLKSFINTVRIARLATADARGTPHLIPVCFAYDGVHFYSVLDGKPKRASLMRLKRVRNIVANPRAALVLDHYEEEWDRLWYVLVTGAAMILQDGLEHSQAIDLLKNKYDQYRSMDIDGNPLIKIIPNKITSWRGNSGYDDDSLELGAEAQG